MSNDRARLFDSEWEREWSLFRRAGEIPPAERPSFLERECAAEPEFRRRIEDLLAAAQQPSPLFDKPWIQVIASAESGTLSKEAGERIATALTISGGTLLADRFEIVRPLGRGGMGAVYEAYDRTLGAHVAVKIVDPALGHAAAVRQRFHREVNLARRVTHPNVCRIFDVVEEGDSLFLTMELLAGETLAERLSHGSVLPDEARMIAVQIASALAEAHRMGIVHRDLKPANVVLVPDGSAIRAVVTDFGLAISTTRNDLEQITKSGQLLGTLAYMAPEQLEGSPVTPAADLYALGLLLHQMLTGRLPFGGDTPVSIAFERLRRPVAVTLPPTIATSWQRIILRCLERNPQDRFGSATEVITALRGETPVRLASSSRRTFVAAAALVALIVTSAAVLLRPRGSEPAASAERKWLLIAAFENRTGDPLFDGTIEYALERELSDSARLSVLPRERIDDVLALMKRSAGSRIDHAAGREVALRDGEVHALVSGRIQRLGSKYVVHAQAAQPQGGEVLASIGEEASSVDGITAAIRRIAGRLRENLGEEPAAVHASQAKLARVTTPSLRALQLYSRADAVIGDEDNAAAEKLLEEAIAADPSFASAHIHLAWAIKNQNRPRSDYMPHARRAFELAETASDRERYFIRSGFFQMEGRLEEAIASYRALLNLDPNHYWAVNNLANIFGRFTLRLEEAVPYAVRRAELRPHDVLANQRAAEALAIWARQPDKAIPFVRRGLDLHRENETPQRYPPPDAWLQLYGVHQTWVGGDIKNVVRELDSYMQSIPKLFGRSRNAVADHVGQLYLATGKIAAAESAFELISDARWRQGAALEVALVKGDEPAILRLLKERANAPHPGQSATAVQLVRRGARDQALRIVGYMRERQAENLELGLRIGTFIALIDGEIALADGNPARAVELLEPVVSRLRPSGYEDYFLASQSLARAWDALGDEDRARRVLEDAWQQRSRTYPWSYRVWMELSIDLAECYDKAGDREKLDAVLNQLQSLLRAADGNHPLRARVEAITPSG